MSSKMTPRASSRCPPCRIIFPSRSRQTKIFPDSIYEYYSCTISNGYSIIGSTVPLVFLREIRFFQIIIASVRSLFFIYCSSGVIKPTH
jgi:hypothetical protein